ncbi:MAG: hypothetical protein R3275_12010 [Saprospiraceae bacterium]|nr:hypothetical protein [Saprospiraceae bacterium]
MNYKFWINIVLAISLAGLLTAQDEVNDFRGLQWGENLSEATFDHNDNPNFIYKGDIAGNKTYALEDEDLTLGTVELRSIRYHFNEFGNFTRLILQGHEDYNEDMESILLNRLGPPTDALLREYAAVRVWEEDNVTVVFRSHLSKDFTVDFRSKIDLMDKMKKNANVDDF